MSWDFDAPAGPFPTEDVEDDSFDDWPSPQAKEEEGEEALLDSLNCPINWDLYAANIFYYALDLVKVSPSGVERDRLINELQKASAFANEEEDEDDS